MPSSGKPFRRSVDVHYVTWHARARQSFGDRLQIGPGRALLAWAGQSLGNCEHSIAWWAGPSRALACTQSHGKPGQTSGTALVFASTHLAQAFYREFKDHTGPT